MSVERVCFATASGTLVLEVSVPEALPVALAVFPDDRCEDGGSAPDFVLERAEGAFVLRAAWGRWTSADLDAVLVHLELALAESLVRRSGLPGVHAGGVVIAGRAVLFPGEGGSGKSSLTAALAARGVPVLGDDVVLLDAAGLAHPFRRLVKVEEPARSILGLPASSSPLSGAWGDAAFYRPADLGSRWADAAPVGAVVRPMRVEGAPAGLVPRRPAEVLPGLLAGVVLSERIAPQDFEAVVAALAGAACWDLRYGATREGAEALLATLG